MDEDEGNLKISDYKKEEEGNMVEDNQESFTSEGNERIMSVDESATLNLNLLDKRLQKRRKKDGIITIIGLCLQKMEIGLICCLSNVNIYYAFYLHTFDPSITKENQFILNSVLGLTQQSTIWVGGILQLYIGIRLVMALGNAFLIAGCIGCIFLKNILGFYFMMAIFGIGIGAPGQITNVNCFLYFPKKRSLISGIATIAWTLSSSFFNFITLYICNPKAKTLIFDEKDKNNEENKGKEFYNENGNGDDLDNIKYNTIFMLISVIVLSILSIILTYKFNKENYEGSFDDDDDEEEEKKEEEKKEEEKDKDNLAINDSENNSSSGKPKEEKESKKKKDEDDGITFYDYLKQWRFYTCFFLNTFKLTYASFVMGSFIVFALQYKTVSTANINYITSSAFAVNSAVTFVISLFLDKFKYKTVIIPTYILMLAHAFTFRFIKKNSVLYIMYYYVINVLVNFDNLSSFPHYVKIFGNKFSVIIFGIFGVGGAFFGFAMSFFYKYALKDKENEEYDNSLDLLVYITATFGLVSLVFMILESEKPLFPKKDEEK